MDNTRVLISHEQISAIKAAALRLLGSIAEDIDFEPLHTASEQFIIKSSDGRICIQGSSVSALMSGLRWYLTHHLKGSISWNQVQIPEYTTLPIIETPIQQETLFTYRYYLNYCTYGYTSAFWGGLVGNKN